MLLQLLLQLQLLLELELLMLVLKLLLKLLLLLVQLLQILVLAWALRWAHVGRVGGERRRLRLHLLHLQHLLLIRLWMRVLTPHLLDQPSLLVGSLGLWVHHAVGADLVHLLVVRLLVVLRLLGAVRILRLRLHTVRARQIAGHAVPLAPPAPSVRAARGTARAIANRDEGRPAASRTCIDIPPAARALPAPSGSLLLLLLGQRPTAATAGDAAPARVAACGGCTPPEASVAVYTAGCPCAGWCAAVWPGCEPMRRRGVVKGEWDGHDDAIVHLQRVGLLPWQPVGRGGRPCDRGVPAGGADASLGREGRDGRGEGCARPSSIGGRGAAAWLRRDIQAWEGRSVVSVRGCGRGGGHVRHGAGARHVWCGEGEERAAACGRARVGAGWYDVVDWARGPRVVVVDVVVDVGHGRLEEGVAARRRG